MPKKSDLLFSKGSVHLISFSGAHSVGKSTLISEVKKNIKENLILIPSCSSEWFKRNPECKTYDDVNKLGLRTKMQSELPSILYEFLHQEIAFLDYSRDNTILCDRWFSDISAYTISELGNKNFELIEENIPDYFCVFLKYVKMKMQIIGSNFYFTEVFIPISSCSHQLLKGEGQDGKPRATIDQIEWEKNYNAVRNRYSIEGHTLTIQSASVADRVSEIMRRIE